ncbi:STAS domain-containing protein [Ancylobacter lacus]|uniref:STAS domain-containing protein n=1 Tax=Ancylobacter lacus TaxID=2579970 RepID=UPI001BCF595C|nr:STAS domain-containing protein [Ancylobacter lacus]MBS7538321.1 STAS domain-containing protein [Ancylobacter lacus]
MQIDREQNDTHTVIRVKGRLDTVHAKTFESYVCDTIRDVPGALVIDMSQVDYIASSGLRSLLIAGKQMKAAQRDLALSGLQPHVREVFDISGFATIFKIV